MICKFIIGMVLLAVAYAGFLFYEVHKHRTHDEDQLY